MEATNGNGATRLCGAKTRSGGRCRQPAGHGTGQPFGPCKKHGGCLPGPRKAAAKAMLLATADEMGLSLEIEPHDLLLATVHSVAGSLAFAQAQVAKLAPHDRSPAAAYWLEAYAQAQDRATRTSKAAMDAGISERKVQLAARTGALIAAAAERAMGRMARPVPVEDRAEFARLFGAELARLEMADDGGEDT
jgi:hypothetical protein